MARTALAPFAGLVQAANGELYGTTGQGGTNGDGTIFKIAPSGTLTTLYSFCQSGCAGAPFPFGPIQATNGDFYGTTENGGANGQGTVFKITPGGTLSTLYSFCSQGGSNCTDGANPFAGLVQASNGDLYGTTYYGGANFGGAGTVFKIAPSGALTTLYSFCAQSNCTDGGSPLAGLVQATNGDLYGTTFYGGVVNTSGGYGTIFKITPGGTLTTLHSFCAESGCPDGGAPFIRRHSFGLSTAVNSFILNPFRWRR
jgi:uncharacterized repeat protein (TIGR03803 family)